MRECRMTDAELQALIAPVLDALLRSAGFVPGRAEGTPSGEFWFPINLNFAGHVAVSRQEDGTWVFTQEMDPRLVERTFATHLDHGRICTEAMIRLKAD